jgi:hypothetical protein
LRAAQLCRNLAFISLGLVLTACAGRDERVLKGESLRTTEKLAEAPAARDPVTAPQTGPSVRILKPADKGMLTGRDVQVTVAVENFNVVAKQGRAPESGEGHVHFYLDVEELPASPGQHAAPPGRSGYYSTSNTSYTWRGVPPGEHKFAVQLVSNDHRALETPITAEVTATVR